MKSRDTVGLLILIVVFTWIDAMRVYQIGKPRDPLSAADVIAGIIASAIIIAAQIVFILRKKDTE